MNLAMVSITLNSRIITDHSRPISPVRGIMGRIPICIFDVK